MVMKYGITQETLKLLVSYDPETGIFTRIGSPNPVHVGKEAKGLGSRGYLQMSVKNRQHPLHRLAWFYVHGVWPEQHVDHIDGDRTNNRIANLRCVSASENRQNLGKAHSNNKSGYLGVSARPYGRWHARIKLNGQVHPLGYYATPELAHAAYLEAKKLLHKFSERI